jgi:hypothetical protein
VRVAIRHQQFEQATPFLLGDEFVDYGHDLWAEFHCICQFSHAFNGTTNPGETAL